LLPTSSSKVVGRSGQLERLGPKPKTPVHDRIQKLPLTLFFVYLRLVRFRDNRGELPLSSTTKSSEISRPSARFGGFSPVREGVLIASPNKRKTEPLTTRHHPAPPTLSGKHAARNNQASLPLAIREKHKE
jgi:hypothetical protein